MQRTFQCNILLNHDTILFSSFIISTMDRNETEVADISHTDPAASAIADSRAPPQVSSESSTTSSPGSIHIEVGKEENGTGPLKPPGKGVPNYGTIEVPDPSLEQVDLNSRRYDL